MAPLSVCRISGEVAEEGDTVLLRIETEEDAREFRLARSDLVGLVHMLLALADPPMQPDVDFRDGSGSPSLPATSLSLGETADGQAMLGIQVGPVPLTIVVPRAALAQLAYAMLAATASNRSPT